MINNRERAMAEYDQQQNEEVGVDEDTVKMEAQEKADTAENNEKVAAMKQTHQIIDHKAHNMKPIEIVQDVNQPVTPKPSIIQENRIGIFGVDEADLLTPLIRSVMEFCVVVRAEHFMHSQAVDYIAYSEMFAPLKSGQPTPRYMWVMNKAGDIKARDVTQVVTKNEASRERQLDKLETDLKEPITDTGATA
ncbi:hypothetical protein HN682_07920 [Candidatus Peregrinibacteria bacterium]|jgi:hypothetical protein|nr:hypothetical protein [Candidatus Peregrinibacteria bacterium]